MQNMHIYTFSLDSNLSSMVLGTNHLSLKELIDNIDDTESKPLLLLFETVTESFSRYRVKKTM